MFLCHHGIKGQKWGVRRYQNKDGTLTKAGKERLTYRNNIIRNEPYSDDVNKIVNSLSDKEKKLLGASLNEDWRIKDSENYYDQLTNIAKTFVQKSGDTPVSMLEIWTNGSDVGQIAIATLNDEKYRGKGYASKNVENAIKWVDRYGNKTVRELEWIAEKSNAGSNALAKKFGFEQIDVPDEPGWENYNMYIRKTKSYKGG